MTAVILNEGGQMRAHNAGSMTQAARSVMGEPTALDWLLGVLFGVVKGDVVELTAALDADDHRISGL